MEEIAIMFEIQKLEQKIAKYKRSINSLNKKIKDCEDGLAELSEYENKVDSRLNEEDSKWKNICSGLPCHKFTSNCQAKTAQLFAGEKYYNFQLQVSEQRKTLNDEILEYEDEIKKLRNKISRAEDEIRVLKSKL